MRNERAAELAGGAGGGEAAERRLAKRQEMSAPVLADLKVWMQSER